MGIFGRYVREWSFTKGISSRPNECPLNIDCYSSNYNFKCNFQVVLEPLKSVLRQSGFNCSVCNWKRRFCDLIECEIRKRFVPFLSKNTILSTVSNRKPEVFYDLWWWHDATKNSSTERVLSGWSAAEILMNTKRMPTNLWKGAAQLRLVHESRSKSISTAFSRFYAIFSSWKLLWSFSTSDNQENHQDYKSIILLFIPRRHTRRYVQCFRESKN